VAVRFVLAVLFFLLPETSAANILYRRTRRLRKATGNESLRCDAGLETQNMSIGNMAKMILVRPLILNFTEPMVFPPQSLPSPDLRVALRLVRVFRHRVHGYIWLQSWPGGVVIHRNPGRGNHRHPSVLLVDV
jgi:hypothetical protein